MARLDEVNLDEFDFDSPDAPVVARGKTNMKRRLIKTLERLSEDGFAGILHDIVAAMTGNAYFAEPWWTDPLEKPTSASLATDQTAYLAAKSGAADGDKTKIALRTSLRAALTADLKKLAQFIELKANGDVTMLESTGYELSKVPTPAGSDPLPAPQDLRVLKGELPGVLIARCKSVKGAASYETHICATDPGVPANWSQTAISKGCRRIDLEGLTPGTLYYVRVRAINQNGPGAWSGVESLRAD